MTGTAPFTSERRKFSRFDTNLGVDLLGCTTIPIDNPIQGEAVNFSREGFGLKIRSNLSIGSQVSTAVFFDDRDSVCLCEVIWKKEMGQDTFYGLHVKHWGYLDPQFEKKLLACSH